jgi:quinol monooxygenase YgiN
MLALVVAIQIKPGFKEQFIEEMKANASGAVNTEPGCVRFDILQDDNDTNRLWLYEVYKDEAAFQAHQQTPHFRRIREVAADWREESPLGGPVMATSIWPPDEDWS